ncbi:MAG TPA: glycosyltransferase family 2 protein [Thermomicrobiaceae bacterium]|nr:glycosyltransferase family 2 protein [Thermomicrobiaceae bacterium]
MPIQSQQWRARAVALITGAYLLYYLWWRSTATLNLDALVFSLIFLLAELQGALSFVLFTFMTWDCEHEFPFEPLPECGVDIFIPTFNEPLDILEATLVGCGTIRYPHTTYVLDDGRRPEVAALAAALGCRYLTRENNLHAKAGNLNAALARTDGEFVVILDADTVPQPDFVDKTLGYFVDERVALVQLPQEFYNADSIQHAGRHGEPEPWHDQALFYRVIQPGKNRWNAAFWCGSPAIVRRAALDSVGGVATGSITEDIHTSLRLHSAGWKTIYHNETLAYGIAPQTLHAFALQRLRWAQGTMQILRSRENPLIKPRLTLAQRLNYLASMLTYFDSFQKLIYLLVPALILVTGVLPLTVSGRDYLVHWLPYFALGILANRAVGRGSFRYLRVEEYNLLKMFTFIWASSVIVWPRRLGFRVTPKETANGVYAQERRQVAPLALLLGLIAAAVALALANVMFGIHRTHMAESIYLVAIFWALVNAGILVGCLYAVLHRVHARKRYRFPAHVPAIVLGADGSLLETTTSDLSLQGMGLVIAADQLWLSPRVEILLALPEGDALITGDILHARGGPRGRTRVGVRFREMNAETRRRLISYLFVTLPRGATATTQPFPAPAAPHLDLQPAAAAA